MNPLRFLMLLCSIGLTLYAISLGLGTYNPTYLHFAFIVVAICTISFFYFQQHSEQRGNWIKPSNILFVCMVATNFQTFANILAGYVSIYAYDLCSPYIINLSAIVSSLSLFAFCYGYMLCPNKHLNKKPINIKNPVQNKITIPQSYLFVVFQWLAFVLWLMHINVQEYISGSVYATSNDVAESNYYELILQAAITAYLVKLIVEGKKEQYNSLNFKDFWGLIPWSTYIIVAIYLILRVMSGDRGPVIYTLCTFIYSYIALSHKKYSLIFVTVVFVCGATIISVLGVLRMIDTSISFSDKATMAFESFNEKGRFAHKSVFNPTEELAYSFKCNQVAIHRIETDQKSYQYGWYQLCHILRTIPFGSSFLVDVLGYDTEDLSSSLYISNEFLGENSKSKLGTSSVADYYLEGGAIGVLIGFVLLGVCFRKLDQVIYYGYSGKWPIIVYSVVLICVSHSMYIARSSLLAQLKPVPIILIFIIAYNILLIRQKEYKRQ